MAMIWVEKRPRSLHLGPRVPALGGVCGKGLGVVMVLMMMLMMVLNVFVCSFFVCLLRSILTMFHYYLIICIVFYSYAAACFFFCLVGSWNTTYSYSICLTNLKVGPLIWPQSCLKGKLGVNRSEIYIHNIYIYVISENVVCCVFEQYSFTKSCFCVSLFPLDLFVSCHFLQLNVQIDTHWSYGVSVKSLPSDTANDVPPGTPNVQPPTPLTAWGKGGEERHSMLGGRTIHMLFPKRAV